MSKVNPSIFPTSSDLGTKVCAVAKQVFGAAYAHIDLGSDSAYMGSGGNFIMTTKRGSLLNAFYWGDLEEDLQSAPSKVSEPFSLVSSLTDQMSFGEYTLCCDALPHGWNLPAIIVIAIEVGWINPQSFVVPKDFDAKVKVGLLLSGIGNTKAYKVLFPKVMESEVVATT